MQQRDVRVRVDFRLWDYLKYVPGNERTGYWHQIQLDGFDGIFALRTAYWDRWFLVNGSASQLDLQQPNLSQFYDSGRMQLLDHVDEGDALPTGKALPIGKDRAAKRETAR